MLRYPAIVLLCLTAGVPAAAQIPERFENLRVLPQDIARPQLVATMKGFTLALGVRCQHCHVYQEGTSPDDLRNFDFRADDKPAKQKARVMLRMIGTINDTILPSLPARSEPAVKVECVTCHRGAPVPRI